MSTIFNLWCIFRRCLKGQEGATAIEFAFVITPLIFMIGSIFELGLVQFTQFQIQNGVQDAARTIRLGPPAGATGAALLPLQADLKAQICRNVVFIRNCATAINLEVVHAATFVDLSPDVNDLIDVGSVPTPAYLPGGSNTVGSVIATFDWQFIFPLMTVFANISGNPPKYRLGGSLIFKNEQF